MGIFSIFEKVYPEKWKKNQILVYPGLRYAHKLILLAKVFFENVSLSTKFELFGEILKLKFLFAIKKNASLTISLYEIGMISTFF